MVWSSCCLRHPLPSLLQPAERSGATQRDDALRVVGGDSTPVIGNPRIGAGVQQRLEDLGVAVTLAIGRQHASDFCACQLCMNTLTAILTGAR